MSKITVTADRFISLRNVKQIFKSITEAPYHMVCMTINYKLIKERKGNRDGLQEDRVKNFIKKLKENRFYPVLGMVFVDSKGNLIDGHHRYNALKREGKPIVFMVIDEMTLNEIADFNTNKSSSWKNKDNFGSACDTGAELAMILDQRRIELLSKYNGQGITEKDINIGDMYGILVEVARFFGSGGKSVTREMYEDKKYVDKARSIEYGETLENYVLIKVLLLGAHKRYKITKAVMECTFTENKKAVNFKLENFIKNLTPQNFKYNDNSGTDDFVKEAVRIHNIRRPKNQRAIELS